MTKVNHFCWFTFGMEIIHTINYFFSPVFFRGCWSAWWWWWVCGWWTWPAMDDPTYSLGFFRDSGHLLIHWYCLFWDWFGCSAFLMDFFNYHLIDFAENVSFSSLYSLKSVFLFFPLLHISHEHESYNMFVFTVF